MNEEPDINIENLGDVRWHLCLCLVLAWMFVILFVSRGIQSTGKVIASEYRRHVPCVNWLSALYFVLHTLFIILS